MKTEYQSSYCHDFGMWLQAEFGLVTRYIDHLYTRLGTTSTYSATANHNSQITTRSTKHFPACCVFTSRSLATASNSGDPSASRALVLSSQPPAQNFLSTDSKLDTSESESESYTTTDCQSTICLGIKHPSGAYEQIFITVRQLRVSWCGALSRQRGRSTSTNWITPIVFLITPPAQTEQKTLFPTVTLPLRAHSLQRKSVCRSVT
jgi:hypothetical protein